MANSVEGRLEAPWLLFTIHRPLYSSDSSGWPSHSPGCPLQVVRLLLLLFAVLVTSPVSPLFPAAVVSRIARAAPVQVLCAH